MEEMARAQEEEKKTYMSEGLENMERIITEKYELILKEQTAHFKTKIKYLESEIALLQ